MNYKFLGLRKRSAVIFSVVLASAFLPNCAGFQAIHYGDPDAILYIVNNSPTVFTAPTRVTPTPLRRIPRGSPESAPTALPSGAAPKQAVKPSISAAPALFPDGQVNPAPLNQTPFSSVGKLTYNKPGDPNSSWSCTAQLIGSQGVLLTAGHCLWDGAWSSNLSFSLAYNSGNSAGVYGWQCAAIVSGWTDGNRNAFDYGLIKLRGTPPAGVGMDINVGSAHVIQVGYPINYFNAEVMVYEGATKNDKNPSAIANNMSHGSSGGGWFINTATGPSAVAVNSAFHADDDLSPMSGPSLSMLTLEVYDFVATGCLDRVRPSGAPPALTANLHNNSKADTTMSIATEDVSAGTFIETETSDECACEGHVRAVARNKSSSFRLVGVQRFTALPGGKEESSTDYFVLKPNDEKRLGCFREMKAGSSACEIEHQFLIESDRGVPDDSPKMPTIALGVSMDTNLAATDIGQCVAKCSKPQPNNDCLDLEESAIGPLAPLGQFAQQIDRSATAKDGTVIQRDSVVRAYGGDPAKTSDPCIRSDLAKEAEYLSNRGLACLVQTKTLVPVAGLKTRLTMPAHVLGRPTAWSPALVSLSNVKATLFPQKTVGPKIDFSGNTAGRLNPLFGGDVHAVSAVSDNILVVSTSNGCIKGAYKK